MKTMIRRGICISSMILLLAATRCITTPICVTSSTVPIPYKTTVQRLGKAQGSNTAWSVLGLWMVGRPDLEAAIDEAVRSRGGDALVNVKCYERWGFLFTTVQVEGEAVKFIEAK
jgi:hypothetical protein